MNNNNFKKDGGGKPLKQSRFDSAVFKIKAFNLALAVFTAAWLFYGNAFLLNSRLNQIISRNLKNSFLNAPLENNLNGIIKRFNDSASGGIFLKNIYLNDGDSAARISRFGVFKKSGESYFLKHNIKNKDVLFEFDGAYFGKTRGRIYKFSFLAALAFFASVIFVSGFSARVSFAGPLKRLSAELKKIPEGGIKTNFKIKEFQNLAEELNKAAAKYREKDSFYKNADPLTGLPTGAVLEEKYAEAYGAEDETFFVTLNFTQKHKIEFYALKNSVDDLWLLIIEKLLTLTKDGKRPFTAKDNSGNPVLFIAPGDLTGALKKIVEIRDGIDADDFLGIVPETGVKISLVIIAVSSKINELNAYPKFAALAADLTAKHAKSGKSTVVIVNSSGEEKVIYD